MLRKQWFWVLFVLAWLFTAAWPGAAVAAGPSAAQVTVFASGLNNPRGLKFGPDGYLYVAEGGLGGTDSTVGQCVQVAPPVGPYTGTNRGPQGSRISRIDRHGVRSTVIEGLPSSQTSAQAANFVSGLADVAFIGGRLYALLAGAGCSHGVTRLPNGVLRILPHGRWHEIANLSAFYQAHPVAQPSSEDFEPDGTSYSMIAVRGRLYVVEPNHGELDRVSAGGRITRIVDISKTQGHIVPTAIAYHNGAFYVGNLDDFPAHPGSKIMKITLDGKITDVADGLTTVLGVAFDRRGRLYALETSAPATEPAGPPVVPGSGRVVRLDDSGHWQEIAGGLIFPTAMTFGPDGRLYVSNFGFQLGPSKPNLGQIVAITLAD